MLKQLIFILLLSSLSFSVVGEQCPDLAYYCVQKACTKAGGQLSEAGTCEKGGAFDEATYEEELDFCDYSYEYCVENDGVVKNMSCCGPIFIFLSALAMALYADGTQ